MPNDRAVNSSRPVVEVEGTELTDTVAAGLARCIVDCHLHLPDMFVLQFFDGERDIVHQAKIKFGTRIVVKGVADGAGAPQPLITGEVTALEQETDSTGTWTTVRGYDPSHRLCRGRNTRTFADTTDADLVRQIGGDAGLDLGEIESGGATYEHVSQVNLTDWEFLRGRAHETGHELAVVEGRLTWRTPADTSTAPTEPDELGTPPTSRHLMLGRDLVRFRPRVTAAAQVGEVQVRGWDPSTKQAVVGSAPAGATSAHVGVTPRELADTFSAGPFVVVDRPVSNQTDADAVAGAVAEQIGGAHAEADGTAYGDPSLVPGAAIHVGGVGWPHDGDYVLTSARHVYDEEGYHTEFAVSGRQERSLLGLTSMGATKGAHRASGPPVYGLVVGQVTDVADPQHQFRAKVSFPWLSEDYESWWCRVAQPGAGSERGLVWLPEVGDEVIVGFAHGDTRVPFVVGSLYNGVDAPPMAGELVDENTGAVNKRALVSRTNHRLVLSDADSDSTVLLATGDDKMTIKLDSSQSSITVDSSGTVTIHGGGNISINGDADISLQANGSLSLKGQAGVTIDGGPQVAVTGSIIKLN